MKPFLKTFLFVLLSAFFISSCQDSYDSLVSDRLEENPVPDQTVSGDSGDADFSNYVAIGNSLTAGFMDAALYNAGQQNSLAALLAEQFTYAGAPNEFNQPNINSELGFNTSVSPNPQNGTVLGRYKLDTSIPGPSPTVGGDPIEPYSGDTGTLNNFGVPGILVGQLLAQETGGPNSQQNPAYNPFYARFASNPGSSTILGDAIATQPSFFTLWIGSNDVLGYAMSGASNPNLLTSEQDFQNYFSTTISELMDKTSAQGVVATIPPVTAVPFFHAVSYDAIELTEEDTTQLNPAFESVNNALQAVANNFQGDPYTQEAIDARKVSYTEGSNPILVNDPSLEDFEEEFDALGLPQEQRQALVPYEQSRPLNQGELVTLSAGSVLGTEYNPQSQTPTTIGVVIPLGFNSQASAFGDAYYLTLPEQGQIQNRTTAFNTIIANSINANSERQERLALYNINDPGGAFFDLLGISDGNPGLNVDGVNLLPDFSPNGVFSTDGVHPNQRGNAILANEFIRVIEDNFNASIPDVDVLNLPSVQVCSEQVGECLSVQQQQKVTARVGKITYDISARK